MGRRYFASGRMVSTGALPQNNTSYSHSYLKKYLKSASKGRVKKCGFI